MRFPMSFEQESIWYHDQRGNGTSAYLQGWAYRLRGAIDHSALQAALTAIVARHETLRARHLFDGDRPRFEIVRPMDVPLEIRSVTPETLPGALRRAVSRPIDLGKPPALVATLLCLDAEDAVLALTLHHAVTDNWSLAVLNRDLSELYEAAVERRAPRLPALPVRFHEYAARQQEEPLDHWREVLRNAPELSTFPADRPRPAARSQRGGQVEFIVDSGTGQEIRRLSRELRTTPFVVLATALAALMHRLCGQEDIVLGTPVSHRQPDTEGLIACLTDLAPLRVFPHHGITFERFVARMRDQVVAAVRHRNVSFGRLVREFATHRSLDRSPLAQVVFGVEDVPADGVRLGQAERLRPHDGSAKYDAFVHLVPAGSGYRGFWEYSADLFDEDTVHRLAERYTLLLADAAARPGVPISELDVMSGVERTMITQWGSGASAAVGPPVHELVAGQARRTPEAIAVRHGGRTLTYAGLLAAADRVADALPPGELVGIALERGIDQVVAVLGVLRAGCACLPLDPAYPDSRITYMAEDSGVRLLLTPRGPKVRNVPASSRPNAAYVLYTSGSSGTPNGVVMEHGPLANLVAWQRARSAPGGRTLQYAPLGFDVAFQELFSTWTAGGELVLVDDDERRDPARLLELVIAHRITRLFLPFVALQQLVEHACAGAVPCPDLREVCTAGEQLQIGREMRMFFTELAPAAVLENQYGPTETHVVTAERLRGDPAGWPDLPSIGRPIAGAEIHLLDSGSRHVPQGVAGELCVGGPVTARGYLHRPGLTAERFVRLPSGERVYRTGDLAAWLPDGRITLLGRQDRQVKIRGHRVEPGEVEAALRALPDVRDAVVLAVDGRLIAWYVGRPDAGLGERLRSRLPAPLIPARYVPVDALPLTPSGKVDRRALTLPAHTGGAATCLTGTEKQVAELFATVLGLGEVGRDEDFFTLGGDSLLATRLAFVVRRELAVDLPVRAVFEHLTARGLARHIESLMPLSARRPCGGGAERAGRGPWLRPGERGRDPAALDPALRATGRR